jgi:hypothetical protein
VENQEGDGSSLGVSFVVHMRWENNKTLRRSTFYANRSPGKIHDLEPEGSEKIAAGLKIVLKFARPVNRFLRLALTVTLNT